MEREQQLIAVLHSNASRKPRICGHCIRREPHGVWHGIIQRSGGVARDGATLGEPSTRVCMHCARAAYNHAIGAFVLRGVELAARGSGGLRATPSAGRTAVASQSSQ